MNLKKEKRRMCDCHNSILFSLLLLYFYYFTYQYSYDNNQIDIQDSLYESLLFSDIIK